MSILCYRRQQRGVETLSDENYQETSETRDDEYFRVSGDRNEDKGRGTAEHTMGREEKTVYGEATVSLKDGATENQLYPERTERGL